MRRVARPVLAAASVAIACGGSPRTETGTTPATAPPAAAAVEPSPAAARSAPPPTSAAPRENPLDAEYAGAHVVRVLEGDASYYADSLAGNHTANGETYNPEAFTAANRRLPFGTVLRVTREDTGASVLVRVNDRGPFGRRRRVLDLSRAAAETLHMVSAGVIRVRAEVLAN